MADSTHLGLTYLEASQAQKHVTVNEALARIDALVQLTVLSRILATPPATPADGDRYLLPASPTGDWLGQAAKIAVRLAGQWVFVTPREGWALWVADEDVALSFNGTSWLQGSVPSALQNMAMVGINATADATNKLTVSSAATLFNHAGAGHQIKFNKNTASDTASLLWQTGFSGRAEVGTAGDDRLHIKVSADGTTFSTLMIADALLGSLRLPSGAVLEAQTAPASPINGQIWRDGTSGLLMARQNGSTVQLISAGVGPQVSPQGQLNGRFLIMN
jgi:hypothetical protein